MYLQQLLNKVTVVNILVSILHKNMKGYSPENCKLQQSNGNNKLSVQT